MSETRPYKTNIKEKIAAGECWKMSVKIDNDNAIGLYDLNIKSEDGLDYTRFINSAIRKELQRRKRKK